jgi:O-antigen/teichoic acid export membrane protein
MNDPVVGTVPAPPDVNRPITSVRRGFGWTFTGYAVYMACQWAMLVVLTRWGAQADVRLFAIALATTTPIILFSNLGLRRVLASDASSEHPFADYFTLRLATNFAALAIIAGFIAAQGHGSEAVWVTLAMGAAKMIESTSDILHGYFQERRRIDLSSKATIARGILSLAAFSVSFLLTKQVFWAIFAMGASWAAILVFYEWPRAARFLRESGHPVSPGTVRRTASKGGWLRLGRTATPLGIVALLLALKGSIPIWVIDHAMDDTAVAVFAAIIYFHHGINRVVSSLGEAASARMGALHAAGDRAGLSRLLSRMLGVSLAVSAIAFVVALAAGGPLVRLFYGPMYAGLGGLLVAILAAAAVANLQTVFDYAMVAVRKISIQPYLYGAAAALLFVLCAALVPRMGLYGAALALGLASAAELAATGFLVGWTPWKKAAFSRVAAEVR